MEKRRHADMCGQLVEHGDETKTRADRCCEKMYAKIVESNNGTKRNALIYATDGGYINIVRLLLDKGADINVKDRYDATPLIIATENEDTDMVQLLLDRGANTNIQESDGYTAFSTAVENGSADIVKLLEPHIMSTKIQRIFRDILTKRKEGTQYVYEGIFRVEG